MTGGLAIVAVLTCMFWGALSGSGPATTAAVGLILFTPMMRHGYKKAFAGSLIANASDLSIIIPPSIAFIIYGSITSVSVSALFVAGIIPGIITGIGMMIVAYFISRHRGYRGLERRGTLKEIWVALYQSTWALLTPVVILGGIYTGVFTPTEAAVVAVFYSLFVAVVVYRSITWRDLVQILVDASVTSSVIMFIVVFAGIFTWVASVLGIVDAAANFIVRISPNAVAMIILVDVLLLILGMFLDAISISYILMPILMPVLKTFNIDPLWYGVIFVVALALWPDHPAVGLILYRGQPSSYWTFSGQGSHVVRGHRHTVALILFSWSRRYPPGCRSRPGSTRPNPILATNGIPQPQPNLIDWAGFRPDLMSSTSSVLSEANPLQVLHPHWRSETAGKPKVWPG